MVLAAGRGFAVSQYVFGLKNMYSYYIKEIY